MLLLLTPSLALAQQSGTGAVPGGATGAVIKQPEPAPEAKPAVVVMPEIVHFENAPYPPEAEKAGLQGNVVLKLTVDKEGNVTAAEVLEPAGNGFDEAAQAAALKFKFKPATTDGVPFAVKIKYGYAFTLKVGRGAAAAATHRTVRSTASCSSPGPSTRWPAQRSCWSRPTAKSCASRPTASGGFKLPQLPPGKYKVKVNAPGFDPLRERRRGRGR